MQLASSSSRLNAGSDAGDLSRQLAARLGAKHRPLYAPTFVGSAALRDALLGEPDLGGAIAAFASVRMAIVGIGAMTAPADPLRSSLLAAGVLDADEIAGLAARGAVGDLVVHPFDAEGRLVAPELEARAIAIDSTTLRAIRRWWPSRPAPARRRPFVAPCGPGSSGSSSSTPRPPKA